MAELEQTEMVATETASETQAAKPNEGQHTETVQLSRAEYEQMQKALKQANKEAAERRKAIEAMEADKRAKEEAEMTELQKAQKRLAETETELKTERRSRLQLDIAAKVGLPAALASRLVGDTPEELESDAKAILEALPKTEQTKPTPKSPGIVINPGANVQQGETEAQMKARLFPRYDPFDPDLAKKLGGGVYLNE